MKFLQNPFIKRAGAGGGGDRGRKRARQEGGTGGRGWGRGRAGVRDPWGVGWGREIQRRKE